MIDTKKIDKKSLKQLKQASFLKKNLQRRKLQDKQLEQPIDDKETSRVKSGIAK
jgi:hypothetical protein